VIPRRLKELLYRFRESIPDLLDQFKLHLAHMPRLFMGRRVAIERLDGHTRFSDKPVSVLTVGRASTADYLLQRFLKDGINYETQRNSLSRKVSENLPNGNSANITIVRCARKYQLKSDFGQAWQIPDAVASVVDLRNVADHPPDQRGNKDNLRRIRKHDLYATISHDPRVFNDFYQDAYLPHIYARFGNFGRPHSRASLARYFKSGGLLCVEQKGERKAAMLYSISGDTAKSHIVAPFPGHRDAENLGAVSATYKFLIDHAMKQECTSVDLGNSRPNLLDGILVHKKHWGARLVDAPEAGDQLQISWPKFNPDIADWLNKTPLIIRDASDLSALTTLSANATAEEARRHLVRLSSAGLKRIIVIADKNDRFDIDTINDIPIRWMDSKESQSHTL
jgi:hypothetical protein